MKSTMSKYSITKMSDLSNIETILISNKIYSSLRMLNIEYPGFKKWYWNLFDVNGNIKINREILFCKNEDRIIAVSILKSDLEEKKICTFRVNKNFQGEGIGTKLMSKSLEWLNTDKPLITVHKSKEYQFQKLFDYFGFKPEQSLKNYYRCFTEISYNGVLPEKEILINKLELINLQKEIYKFISENKFGNINDFIDYCIKIYISRKNIIENYY